MSPQGFCTVCGRTFLVGEAVRTYVSAEGRHEVCELCAGRAAELGWLPADQDGAEERLRAESERKPGFLAKLFTRPEHEGSEVGEHFIRDEEGTEGASVSEGSSGPERQSAPEPLASHELDTERYDVEAEWREAKRGGEPSLARKRLGDLFGAGSRARSAEEGRPASEPSAAAPSPVPPTEVPAPRSAPPTPPEHAAEPRPLPDPAAAGMRPRRIQPDLSPKTRFERAIVRFNAGEAGRTVAGLTRTLGAPSVSVGDLAGEDDVVRVTVAWELTWYQWGVDLGDELRPVYELSRGFEVDEIDSAARQWNASAHDGRVVMVAPSRRPAEDGRPVHR